MLKALNRRHHAHLLRKGRIPFGNWRRVCRKTDLLRRLSRPERVRLRALTTLFLHEKTLNGVQGLVLDEEMRLIIAAQACVLILNLGLDCFDGWVEVVVYPGAFRVPLRGMDEWGVEVEGERDLSGESWQRGPVILSWAEIEAELDGRHPGRNLIVHEFSHKLDMLNGRANGMPPLHPEMDLSQWTAALSQAYEHLQAQLSADRQTAIDDYAATGPAEFFAVISEYFFMSPNVLREHCPAVYEQLRQYYRQDPLARHASDTASRSPIT